MATCRIATMRVRGSASDWPDELPRGLFVFCDWPLPSLRTLSHVAFRCSSAPALSPVAVFGSPIRAANPPAPTAALFSAPLLPIMTTSGCGSAPKAWGVNQAARRRGWRAVIFSPWGHAAKVRGRGRSRSTWRSSYCVALVLQSGPMRGLDVLERGGIAEE